MDHFPRRPLLAVIVVVVGALLAPDRAPGAFGGLVVVVAAIVLLVVVTAATAVEPCDEVVTFDGVVRAGEWSSSSVSHSVASFGSLAFRIGFRPDYGFLDREKPHRPMSS